MFNKTIGWNEIGSGLSVLVINWKIKSNTLLTLGEHNRLKENGI